MSHCSGCVKLETCKEGDEGMSPGEAELGDGMSTERFGLWGGGVLGLQSGTSVGEINPTHNFMVV